MDFYWYCVNYKNDDYENMQVRGYTIANTEDEARLKVMHKYKSDDVYVEKHETIEIE